MTDQPDAADSDLRPTVQTFQVYSADTNISSISNIVEIEIEIESLLGLAVSPLEMRLCASNHGDQMTDCL